MSIPRVDRQLRAILANVPDDRDGLRDACRGVDDWSGLLSAAHAQGVAGVVLAAADRVGIAPSASAAREAAARLRLGAVWRDVLQHTLHRVLAALAKEDVAAVALKGPLLAMRLYDDQAVRPSIDLDVLMDPASLEAAARALRPLGYELEGGALGRFFRQHHYHVHAFHPTLPPLELHFDAYRGFGTSLPAAPLLARATHCTVPGWTDARVLTPEDEFVYLAVHAASHRFQSLVWLFDLKLLARLYPAMRWDTVASVAAFHRLSAVVSRTCALLSDWLGCPRYGLSHLQSMGKARSLMVEHLARPRSIHLANAAAAFLFFAFLCDDGARALAFSRRVVRVKMCHEMPLRVRRRFLS